MKNLNSLQITQNRLLFTNGNSGIIDFWDMNNGRMFSLMLEKFHFIIGIKMERVLISSQSVDDGEPCSWRKKLEEQEIKVY